MMLACYFCPVWSLWPLIKILAQGLLDGAGLASVRGTQPPVAEGLGAIQAPVLLVAGALSNNKGGGT